MNQRSTDLITALTELASSAKPYTKEELRTYDGEEDIDRLLATMAKYALEHPNPKLTDRKNNQPG